MCACVYVHAHSQNPASHVVCQVSSLIVWFCLIQYLSLAYYSPSRLGWAGLLSKRSDWALSPEPESRLSISSCYLGPAPSLTLILSSLKDFYLFHGYVCFVCMYIHVPYTERTRCPCQKRSLGTEVTGGCEPSCGYQWLELGFCRSKCS